LRKRDLAHHSLFIVPRNIAAQAKQDGRRTLLFEGDECFVPVKSQAGWRQALVSLSQDWVFQNGDTLRVKLSGLYEHLIGRRSPVALSGVGTRGAVNIEDEGSYLSVRGTVDLFVDRPLIPFRVAVRVPTTRDKVRIASVEVWSPPRPVRSSRSDHGLTLVPRKGSNSAE
jgi:hypothetical protein